MGQVDPTVFRLVTIKDDVLKASVVTSGGVVVLEGVKG